MGKKLLEQAKRDLEWCGCFFLYLTFIYWSTQAIMKYQSEPAVTNIETTYGDNDVGIRFPTITFCAAEPKFKETLNKFCQMNLDLSYEEMVVECLRRNSTITPSNIKSIIFDDQ